MAKGKMRDELAALCTPSTPGRGGSRRAGRGWQEAGSAVRREAARDSTEAGGGHQGKGG